MVVIENCPCKREHRLGDQSASRLRKRGYLDGTTLVGNLYGVWRVPRLFLIFHPGNLATRIRFLADKYGFEEVKFRLDAAGSVRWLDTSVK